MLTRMKAKNSDGSNSSVAAEYKRGDRVEISSKEEGFVGSYYEAVIVTKLAGNEYIASYNTLTTEDLPFPLREVVVVDNIRPQPPEIQACWFNMGDEIDAYDRDGWWSGTIVGRINEQDYIVYFSYSEEETTYSVDDLRIHQDFVKGKWFRSKTK